MPTIMRKINILSRCEGIYRAEKLRESGLSACHHSYVLAICHHPGMTQDQLAKHICVNKSSVTRSLAQLEEHGFVERRADTHDKRAICVFPTDKMLALYPQIKQISVDWNEYLSQTMDENELALFTRVLDKLANRAQNYLSEKEEAEK